MGGGAGEAATEPPTATQTSTPAPTATSPTPWAGWPTPLFTDPTTPEPFPGAPIELGPGLASWVVMGSDQLPHRDSINTDAFFVIVVDTNTDPYRASVISIPRDLYVFIPGHGMGRINSAFALTGGEGVIQTIRYNFGLPITEGYVYLEMSAFRDFIDFLKGIDVRVTRNILDECADGTVLNYLEGRTIHMDGRTALCYARARDASNDFDRMRRQQEIVKAVLGESIERFGANPGETVERVYDAYKSGIRTNLDFLGFVRAGWHAAGIDPDASLDLYVLQPPIVTAWIKPSTGAYLLVPVFDLSKWIEHAAFGGEVNIEPVP
jgi:LCP family protein required for cell wall assembly